PDGTRPAGVHHLPPGPLHVGRCVPGRSPRPHDGSGGEQELSRSVRVSARSQGPGQGRSARRLPHGHLRLPQSGYFSVVRGGDCLPLAAHLARSVKLVSIAGLEPSALFPGDPPGGAGAGDGGFDRQLFDAAGGAVPSDRAGFVARLFQRDRSRGGAGERGGGGEKTQTHEGLVLFLPRSPSPLLPLFLKEGGAMQLDSKVPAGPLAETWDRHRFDMKLVNRANKRKFRILVVGTGLAGASAAASLAELGYNVDSFCFQDSPRRAHSIAAQGGINAAKNYQNDGDSVQRLFYDTIKGGDYRSREANVYRLAEVSVNIIDQCLAQGLPFAREYGGLLANRSFGGAQVSRTFYCRGQTGQQLLLGAYQALSRQIGYGKVTMHPRTEMLDLVVTDNRARGIVVRDMVTGQINSYSADAVVLATGGYANAYFLSTNAAGCNVTAAYRAYKRGAAFANPCYTQIHPTCIPVAGEHQSKLTLMSESLRNDGRVWVPKSPAHV